MLKPAVIGRDARTNALVRSLRESPRVAEVIHLTAWKAPTTAAVIDELLAAARRVGRHHGAAASGSFQQAFRQAFAS